MRVGEVLQLRPRDVEGRKLVLLHPKSGKESEPVFIPKKVAARLRAYIMERGIQPDERIFPIEIVSKVILRHANLSTTQQYLGNVTDDEAMRWIDNLHA